MTLTKMKIGILGCGAIGSGLAERIHAELKKYAELTAIYDIDPEKTNALSRRLNLKTIVPSSFKGLLKKCHLLIEAVNSKETSQLIRQALKAKKHVLAMSVGRLLNTPELFTLAQKHHRHLLIPSGAIAGIDAVKAAGMAPIDKITLTTRKPPSGFIQNDYLKAKGIDPLAINTETLIFEGAVDEAVKFFPQNINVAATLALASGVKEKIRVRLVTSPEYTANTHEIEVTGSFGRLLTRTENIVCPENPKTSYLAVLSAFQTLKQFCAGINIGT